MIDECDPQLPLGYIKVDEISRRAKVNFPPVSTLIHALQVGHNNNNKMWMKLMINKPSKY